MREDDNAEDFVTDVTNDEINVAVKSIVLLFNNPNVQAYACIYRSLRPTSHKSLLLAPMYAAMLLIALVNVKCCTQGVGALKYLLLMTNKARNQDKINYIKSKVDEAKDEINERVVPKINVIGGIPKSG